MNFYHLRPRFSISAGVFFHHFSTLENAISFITSNNYSITTPIWDESIGDFLYYDPEYTKRKKVNWKKGL